MTFIPPLPRPSIDSASSQIARIPLTGCECALRRAHFQDTHSEESLRPGSGADPDDLEDEIERIYVAERMGRLTRTFDKGKRIVNNHQ